MFLRLMQRRVSRVLAQEGFCVVKVQKVKQNVTVLMNLKYEFQIHCVTIKKHSLARAYLRACHILTEYPIVSTSNAMPTLYGVLAKNRPKIMTSIPKS